MNATAPSTAVAPEPAATPDASTRRSPVVALFRHEWRRTRTLLAAIGAIGGLMVLASSALAALDLPIVSAAGLLIGLLVTTSLVPVVQLALAVEYWLSSHHRGGYFTHSLPIRGTTIYAVKLTWMLLVSLAALLATLVLAAVLWVGFALPAGADPNPFGVASDLVLQATTVMSPSMLVAVAVTVALLYIIWPAHFLFAAAVGSESPLNRLGAGGPVIVYIGLYVVLQVVVMIGMFALPIGVGVTDAGQLGLVQFSLVDAFEGGSDSIMPIGFLPALLLVTLACVWRTARSWRRKITIV
ncbi:hypothetical protein GCM10011490_27100 [Pseudoclavibacter endophyticus]|uniref:Uncharacterized protein n=1 Tax=Pseudoclavibacter endophyticus TaxID=1778590 RepID=A0A6H9WP22_9MICO|nr:hypothetical protein [Pseudoclavibacter endophyticus]KAB1646859.1 hypothetical protein F8O04_14100 [Pseudoclavibacter endophyticus]GGA74953.1 hypothetical protein GCM10011490_27100 [Pseudoclavibacter endophyticus]